VQLPFESLNKKKINSTACKAASAKWVKRVSINQKRPRNKELLLDVPFLSHLNQQT